MKHPLAAIFVAVLAALPLVPGCASERPVTALRDGPRECAELERNCQAPAEALGDPYRHCYETGKSKVSNACINYYYDCIDSCREASANLPEGGQGGEGGEGGAGARSSAGAGGS